MMSFILLYAANRSAARKQKPFQTFFKYLKIYFNWYVKVCLGALLSVNRCIWIRLICIIQASNYMFKVNNRNIRARCEICSKLTIKIPERRHWRPSGIFIVNFEHISHLIIVFLLLTLNM